MKARLYGIITNTILGALLLLLSNAGELYSLLASTREHCNPRVPRTLVTGLRGSPDMSDISESQ